jgi:hypothetical protein
MSDPAGTPTVTIVARLGFDFTAFAAIVSAILDFVPKIAGLAGLVYVLIMIWESKTAKGIVSNWRRRRAEYKLRKMHRSQRILSKKIEAMDMVRRANVRAQEMVQEAKKDAALSKTTDAIRIAEATILQDTDHHGAP